MTGLEAKLQTSIDNLKEEIKLKQKELADAEQNLKDYKNNKTVVEKLLALAGEKVRKKRSPNKRTLDKKDSGLSSGN